MRRGTGKLSIEGGLRAVLPSLKAGFAMKRFLWSLLTVFYPAVSFAEDVWSVTELTPAVITGNPMFDYFFTLVCFFGLLAFSIAMLVKIISRS